MTRLLFCLVVPFLQSIDQGNVYYGSLDNAKNPAEVVASSVFDKIPEYQEIKRRGLDEEDSEYWTLLAKANKKFYKAVRKAAKKDKHDVVVEKGTADLKDAPDITQKVIDALPK